MHQRNTRGSSRSAFVSAQDAETTLELFPLFSEPSTRLRPHHFTKPSPKSSNYVKLLINALLGFLEGWPGWPGFARLERSSTSSAINPAAHTKAAPVRGRRPGRRDSGPTLSWSAPHRDSIPEPHLAQLCRPERGGFLTPPAVESGNCRDGRVAQRKVPEGTLSRARVMGKLAQQQKVCSV